MLKRLGLSRDEWRRTLPITVGYGLILASLYLLKPARNALFLEQQGIAELPFVLLLVAVVGGLTAAIYGSYAKATRIDRLIRITFVVMIGFLFGFRFLLTTGWGWVVYAFYIWVALYGLLCTSLIWLLANAVFTTREARKVFGFIGTGGIAGAILGGTFTSWAAQLLGTENLLFVCAAILLVVIALLWRSTPAAQSPRRKKGGQERDEGLTGILRSPLLRNLALTAGLIATIAVIVDIQFNEIVDRAYPAKDDKTAFFGQFFAYLSLFGFIFQLFVTPLVLRSVGVGVAILILPVAMGLGSGAILIAPGLLAAIIAKGADGAFRHSIHKAATEVFFLPVPAESKSQAKLFLDTTIDTAFTGLGALLVLLLTGPLAIAHDKLSFVTVPLVVVVVYVGTRMRKAYVDAFRTALEGRALDLADLRLNLDEAGITQALVPALQGGNERQITYALGLLGSVRSKALVAPVQALLTHASAEVRRQALIVLQQQPGPIEIESMQQLLQDENELVRLEAMTLKCQGDGQQSTDLLQGFVGGDDLALKVAAIRVIARKGPDTAQDLLTTSRVKALLTEADSSAPLRAALARALAGATDPALSKQFWQLAQDPAPEVVQAAVKGLGASRCGAAAGWLLDRLEDRALRRDARQALIRCGAPAVPELAQALVDSSRPEPVRRMVPRVLAEIPQQEAVNALLADLETAEPQQRHHTVRALSRLCTGYAHLLFPKDKVFEAIRREARTYYAARQAVDVLTEPEPSALEALLLKALKERQERCVEDIFLLMGLRYDPKDMASAYQGIISDKPAIRASALEFLDNLLRKRPREVLLPIVEPPPMPRFRERAKELFGTTIESRSDALIELLQGDDPWLKACTLYVLNEHERRELQGLVRKTAEDPRPLLREAAQQIGARA